MEELRIALDNAAKQYGTKYYLAMAISAGIDKLQAV